MRVYLVGGAVRDRLLGLPVKDRDWLVVGADREQMLARGFRQPDPAFPVFLHPDTGEEYALARRERKVAAGYKGFAFDCDPAVTLQEDLERRDLTINALAEDEQGQIIDLFGGLDDLQQGRLRHVSAAFCEDPVRLLRAARFAAQLGGFGFRISHGTFALMKRVSVSGELRALSRGRLRLEWLKARASQEPPRYWQSLAACGALAELYPRLARCVLPAGSAHEAEIARAGAGARCWRQDDREQAEACWLAAVAASRDELEGLLDELDSGKACRRCAQQGWLIRDWLRAGAVRDGDVLWPLLEGLGAWRDAGALSAVFDWGDALSPAPADAAQAEAALQRLRAGWNAARAVDAAALRDQGLEGPRLGEALRRRRRQALLQAVS